VIAQGIGNRSRECNHKRKECRADAEYRHECVRIDLVRVNSLLVGETEASGFKSEYQNYLKHSDVGHEFGYNSVALGAEESRVYRNEKEVYDAGEDGAQTINHRLPRQLFQGICHNESKNSYFCQIIVILSEAKDLCGS